MLVNKLFLIRTGFEGLIVEWIEHVRTVQDLDPALCFFSLTTCASLIVICHNELDSLNSLLIIAAQDNLATLEHLDMQCEVKVNFGSYNDENNLHNRDYVSAYYAYDCIRCTVPARQQYY